MTVPASEHDAYQDGERMVLEALIVRLLAAEIASGRITDDILRIDRSGSLDEYPPLEFQILYGIESGFRDGLARIREQVLELLEHYNSP